MTLARFAASLSDSVQRGLADGVEAATGMFDDTVRLGVSGLAGAGKTVFITALVANLLRPKRLPLLDVVAEDRFEAALLTPQPDRAVPRFDYEGMLAALAADPPSWPESTRRLAQLRVSVRYRPGGVLMRSLRGTSTLNIDIVDYPGEWLLDTALLDQGYADWSAAMVARAREPGRAELAGAFLEALGSHGPDHTAREEAAADLARRYTAYLEACRADPALFGLAQPGRFLMPGDLEGSPALTFAPLDIAPGTVPERGTLGEMMADRFEAYKAEIVRPFFRDHLSRIDRQVVLVDLLSSLNRGPAAVRDLADTMAQILAMFRPGPRSWLWPILGRRVERILFAATKADHVPHDQHDRLEALMRELLFDPINRAVYRGAAVDAVALASITAANPIKVTRSGEVVACIQGVPMDGTDPVVVFPGLVPTRLVEARAAAGSHRFMRFRPPSGIGRGNEGMANLRLDRALGFLIGDRLA